MSTNFWTYIIIPVIVGLIILLIEYLIVQPIAKKIEKTSQGNTSSYNRKILAWAIIIGTLLIPSIFFIWLAMQIAARVLAPSINDVSEFVTQVSWWVGGIGALYPLVWGITLYPKIEKFISQKLLILPTEEKKQENQQPSIKKTKRNAK